MILYEFDHFMFVLYFFVKTGFHVLCLFIYMNFCQFLIGWLMIFVWYRDKYFGISVANNFPMPSLVLFFCYYIIIFILHIYVCNKLIILIQTISQFFFFNRNFNFVE